MSTSASTSGVSMDDMLDEDEDYENDGTVTVSRTPYWSSVHN